MAENTWTEKFTINWDDISLNDEVTLTGLNTMLQRAATHHAEHLGFGFTQTSALNASWVLFRIHIELLRMPGWREEVIVETWPRIVKGMAAFRDFMVTTANREVLCKATSEWFIIDLTSRRPQRIDKFVDIEAYTTTREAVTRTLPVPDKNINYEHLFNVVPKYSDMDMNGHTNARKYFDWLTDAAYIREELRQPSFVQMTYLSECLLGEEVDIQFSNDIPGWFRGQKKKNDKTAFIAYVENKK